jgi:CRISPR/Cas system-associated exonuclease Cas4 (RecB family)
MDHNWENAPAQPIVPPLSAEPGTNGPSLDTYHVGSPHLGASKIATYLKCPRQWEYTYSLKTPARKSVYAALGVMIHYVCNKARDEHWTVKEATLAADLLTDLWTETRPLTDDPNNPEVAVSFDKARLEWLPWYLHFVQDQVDVCTEDHWVLELPEGTLAGQDLTITLEGTIDRVYNQDGMVVVSDIKSGARKPSQEDLNRDSQLSLYSWAVRQQGVQEDVLELVWLRTQELLRTTRTDEYLGAYMERTVLPVARGIAAGIFPANPNPMYGCGFCGYRDVCEVGVGCAS